MKWPVRYSLRFAWTLFWSLSLCVFANATKSEACVSTTGIIVARLCPVHIYGFPFPALLLGDQLTCYCAWAAGIDFVFWIAAMFSTCYFSRRLNSWMKHALLFCASLILFAASHQLTSRIFYTKYSLVANLENPGEDVRMALDSEFSRAGVNYVLGEDFDKVLVIFQSANRAISILEISPLRKNGEISIIRDLKLFDVFESYSHYFSCG